MIYKAIKINNTAVSNRINKYRILMLVLMTTSVFLMNTGVGVAEDVTGNGSYDIIIASENFLQNTLDLTLNEIYEETEGEDVLNLENQYEIRIKDINKGFSQYRIQLALEKNNVELDNKIIETGRKYSWYDDENHITFTAKVFIGTRTVVVFFENVNQIFNGDTLINNENFTIIYSGLSSGSLNTDDNNNIERFTTLNENVLQSSNFPPASGYSQEFLKENYSLTLLELDVDGNEAWISLSKNGGEVDSKVLRVGDSYNYNSLLSFKLDNVFAGTSSNYLEISNIYQYSEIDSSVIVQNESALLLIGLTGNFILTGGGLEWQLEENYTLHGIDIDIADHSREAMLLITKEGTHVDYAIINVGDSYTYYKNGNLIITADLENIFSGEGGVSLARLNHVYQYSEDTGEILLNDAIHLYSVGNTREVEWQLDQNYSLSAMDIDSKDTPRQVWLRLKKDRNTLEDKFLHSGDNAIFYNSGTKILDLNVGTIFDGKEADLVFISDVYQYSETNENDILLENEPHLFIFGSATGNDWQLYENYTLSFMDIDIKRNPSQVWLRMKKNGVPVYDNVVAQSEEYRFYNNSVLLFEGYIKSVFGGRYLDMLTLTNANQYSELDSTPLIEDTTYTFYPENVEHLMELNEKLSLDENYTMVPVDIQVYHETLWLRLYKGDEMVDEVILLEGQDYSYYSSSREIISTKLATIFSGMNVDLIKLKDLYQYSEVDGSLLMHIDDILLRLGHYSAPGAPTITSSEPTTFISDDVGVSRKFTIFMNQSVDVNWYLNGTEIQFNESVSNAEYTNTSASAGTWIISAVANNANGIAMQNWTWTVMAKSELPVHNINTGENFLTIQAAIDNSSPGDEIHVDSGTYYENVVVNKALILLGERNLTTTIDGNGSEMVVEVVANEVVIEGFRIQNGSNGINVTSSYNTLIGNTVLNNSNTGILLYYSSNNNTLNSNTVLNNFNTGIWLGGSSNNTLIGNKVLNNSNGILLYYSSNNTLSGNTASNNSLYGIVLYYSSNNNMLIGNTASNNSITGIWLHYLSNNNTLFNNTVSNNSITGIILYSSSNNNTLIGNTVSKSSSGIDLHYSSHNILCQNNLFGNTDQNANDYDGNNQWYWGTKGNYYSDYTGTDSNGDGIGDTPYNISGGAGAQDLYPLMQPWNEEASEFISIGSVKAPTNSTITIPVSVAKITNISGISFDLLYNSSVAIVSNVSTNESFIGSSVTQNIDNTIGITRIVLTNSNLISSSAETPMIDITFSVTGGPGSSTYLDLQNVEFSDSGFNPYTPAVVVDGQITVGIKGDFNGNGRVDIGDVAKVAFMVAGKVPEDLHADFNGNGRVDIGDAAKIAFYLAGKVSEL